MRRYATGMRSLVIGLATSKVKQDFTNKLVNILRLPIIKHKLTYTHIHM